MRNLSKHDVIFLIFGRSVIISLTPAPIKRTYLFLLLLALLPAIAGAQTVAIQRVNPTNRWVGMKRTSVQVLVYGPGAGTLDLQHQLSRCEAGESQYG